MYRFAESAGEQLCRGCIRQMFVHLKNKFANHRKILPTKKVGRSSRYEKKCRFCNKIEKIISLLPPPPHLPPPSNDVETIGIVQNQSPGGQFSRMDARSDHVRFFFGLTSIIIILGSRVYDVLSIKRREALVVIMRCRERKIVKSTREKELN